MECLERLCHKRWKSQELERADSVVGEETWAEPSG